jgi:release factor glutamine methyltransferase
MNDELRLIVADLPDHEGWRLIAAATGLGVAAVKLGAETDRAARARLQELVRRRLAGEPLQYVEGKVPFGPVEVIVDGRVLIPRPETEYLLELAAAGQPPRVIVDLGTGSGALALALKSRFPHARVIGVDLSPAALEVARANGKLNRLEIEWLLGDLWEPLPTSLRGMVDLVVANPPYVAEGEWEKLPADVRREPREALVAGPDGTEVAARVLAGVGEWLAAGGRAWVEVGETQAETLVNRLGGEVVADQYGKPRYVRVTRR